MNIKKFNGHAIELFFAKFTCPVIGPEINLVTISAAVAERAL